MKKILKKTTFIILLFLALMFLDSKNVTKATSQYYIKVNYSANVVTIYGADGSPLKAMVCSCGTATPKGGRYNLDYKYRWLALYGGVHGQYCTRITGNILFHSVPYLQSGNPGSLEYWEYDKLGTSASAGCIRLTVADAKWIYENCPSGTTVEFYSSPDAGPLGKPEAMKISNFPNRDWDPTDPDASNPWNGINDVFNYRYYADNYGDLKAAFGYDEVKLKNHYLTCGIYEGRRAIRSFDVKFYKNCNGDLSHMSDMEAIKHYIVFGKREGRVACIPEYLEDMMFDYKYYADTNQDIKAVFGYNEYLLREHWYNFGIKEGRKSSELFCVKDYINYSGDLKNAYQNNYQEGIRHFVIWGYKEGRRTSENFDVKAYKNRYKDLSDAFGNDYISYFTHYILCRKK